jgi:hypothetical protein
MFLDLTPFGVAKDLYGASTGYDVIRERKMTLGERIWCGIAGGIGTAGALFDMFDDIAETAGHYAKRLKNATDPLDDAVVPGVELVRKAPNSAVWRATPGQVGQFSRTQTPWGRNVWQRGDIDWSLYRPDGLTNLEAAQKGFSPLRRVGAGFEGVELHHLNQEVKGGLAEVWTSTHRRVNHNVPPPSWRTTDPDAAAAFLRERPAYWRWRARQLLGV